MANPIHFLKDVKNEMTKVVWPTPKQAARMTIQVIIISLLVAVILGATDYGLNELMSKFVLER
jgi:preprotein translocase subunit SecE